LVGLVDDDFVCGFILVMDRAQSLRTGKLDTKSAVRYLPQSPISFQISLAQVSVRKNRIRKIETLLI